MKLNSQLCCILKHDWNDGHAFCSLVNAVGGSVFNLMYLSKERSKWESNLQAAIDAASAIGIEPLLKAKHIADEEHDHVGIMAYVSRFQTVAKPVAKPSLDKVRLSFHKNNTFTVNSEVSKHKSVIFNYIQLTALFSKGSI